MLRMESEIYVYSQPWLWQDFDVKKKSSVKQKLLSLSPEIIWMGDQLVKRMKRKSFSAMVSDLILSAYHSKRWKIYFGGPRPPESRPESEYPDQDGDDGPGGRQ